jgi:hypothetical protein
MRMRPVWSIPGVWAVVGCIDVPSHNAGQVDAYVCVVGDADCDGWPAVAANAEANDCNDGETTINPGAIDRPDDAIDQDCIDGPATGFAEGVGDTSAATLHTTDIDLHFELPNGMPSTFRIGGDDEENNVLGVEPNGCEARNEEGLGISLFPAFAVHGRPSADPNIVGSVAFDGDGPVRASAVVSWAIELPVGAAACAGPVTIGANLRFTVLPGGMLVRDDHVSIATGPFPDTGSCLGCAAGGTAPTFTSYLTLGPALARIQQDQAPSQPRFEDVGPAGLSPAFCLSTGLPDDNRKLGLVWRFSDAVGYRLRQTDGGNYALVYDWRRGAVVPSGSYQAVTAMFAQVTGGDCSAEMWERMDQFRTPTPMPPFVFDPGAGLYRSVEDPGGYHSFRAMATVDRGFGVRAGALGDHGITVWRNQRRLTAGDDYLVQREEDATYSVWFFSASSGDVLTLAAPRSEPPPPT